LALSVAKPNVLCNNQYWASIGKYMQDRYAGDVGDFGKFGLLRQLLLDRGDVSLGVVWYYFVPHDENNNDGRHINFYEDAALTGCDPELAKRLKRATLTTEQRSVAALEKSGILPVKTRYFRDDTNFYATFPRQTQQNKIIRQEARNNWLKQALMAVHDCQLVFLDPDNGLEIASCAKKTQKKAGKFVFLDELEEFKQLSAEVMVYHHLNMGSPHELQIDEGIKRLRGRFKQKVSVFALRFRPYSPRAFFILCDPSAKKEIAHRLESFKRGPWGQYWDNFKSSG
jgi:hypothetical protein